jgi:predicted ABC-type ATPase
MRYTIFAGVNGAGKSSLYCTLSEKEKELLGVRINVDDIAISMGDWRDDGIQLKAARIAVQRIRECLDSHINFNQETTLSSKNIFNTIKKAADKGFEIYMYYVFVESVDIAKRRINEFVNSFEIFKEAIPLCKRVILYNNTQFLTCTAIIEQGKIKTTGDKIPIIVQDLLKNYEDNLCLIKK